MWSSQVRNPNKEVNFVFPEKGVRPYAVMIDNQGENVFRRED